jgi:mono/diheme cytochrome c family protein
MTVARRTLALLAVVAVAAAPVARAQQGQSRYATCAACHQATGRGIPGAFPPLAGSEFATGAPEIPVRIVLLGLQGPLTVNGQRYNSVMPPHGNLSDADIAATLTYVRSQWGNSASAVTAAQVTAARSALAGRSRPLTGAEVEAMRRGR